MDRVIAFRPSPIPKSRELNSVSYTHTPLQCTLASFTVKAFKNGGLMPAFLRLPRWRAEHGGNLVQPRLDLRTSIVSPSAERITTFIALEFLKGPRRESEMTWINCSPTSKRLSVRSDGLGEGILS